MRIEDQVCTLEQAKRLQELGVKADSVFNYAESGFSKANRLVELIWGNIDAQGGRYTNWAKIPAYTVAELGEMLPSTGKLNEEWTQVSSWRSYFSKEFVCGIEHTLHHGLMLVEFEQPTEAQARAEMLIHLIETGIVSTTTTPEA